MNEETLVSRLQDLTDQSQSVSWRDERLIAAMLIMTRLPPSLLQRSVNTDQTILRFACGLVSNYITRLESNGPFRGKECTSSAQCEQAEKESEAYLALSASFFSSYYDHENATTDNKPIQLDDNVHSCLLEAVKLRRLSETPLGSVDLDIVTALGRIVRNCVLEKRGIVQKSDGTVVKSGSSLDDWIHAPPHFLLPGSVNSAENKSDTHPSNQDELARCVMLNTFDSVLRNEKSSQEVDRSEVDYRSQYAEAVINYLEAHLSQSISTAPCDLCFSQSTLGAASEILKTSRYSSCSERFTVPYKRSFLLDLFHYAQEFPRLDHRNKSVVETSMRLNSLALMYLSYSTRGNWQSIGEFDLGKVLGSCKTGTQACSDDEIIVAVLKLILHCLLVEPGSVDARVQVGAMEIGASFISLIFEAISIVVGTCDLHWMIRNVNMSPKVHAGVSHLDDGAALCLVIRLVVGNLRMGLGHLLDLISEDIFTSVESSRNSVNLVVHCICTLNSTVKFMSSFAEDMGDKKEGITPLNSEALLHIRSSIEDAINSVVQFLVDPVASMYRRAFFGSNSHIQAASFVGKYAEKISAYECAAVACCSFLAEYFTEESVFAMAGRQSGNVKVVPANDIFCAFHNSLRVCLSIDFRESKLVVSETQGDTCGLLTGENQQVTSGVDTMSDRTLISLFPCLTTAASLSMEEGEEGICVLATAMLKEGLCTTAVCFLIRDLFLFANRVNTESELASQVLSAYISCCDLVRALLMIDRLARGEPYLCEAATLTEKEQKEMQACLLLWSRHLVRHCTKMITAYNSNNVKSAKGMLALILTNESLTLLLEAGMICPETTIAIKEADELIGDFP